MRFAFDPGKSRLLKLNPNRGIGFEEVQALFAAEHIVDRRSDDPEQFRAISWVSGTMYSVIYEVRHDVGGEFYYLVTLWKATREERNICRKYLRSRSMLRRLPRWRMAVRASQRTYE